MNKFVGCLILISFVTCFATEPLHPISLPTSSLSIQGTVELDEDVYSGDMEVSAEYAFHPRLSLYVDGAFRFLSYSYEYSTEGYIHNYCNLHVNGFNETYVGAKGMILPYLGLNVGWQFPPGEGSPKNRFHRLNVEPFGLLQFSRQLTLGTAIRYNTFLEDKNFKPGDEIGIKASFVWKPGWNDSLKTGWEFSEIFLYQARIEESENRNLDSRYRGMKDKYRGMKMKFDAMRYFNIAGFSTGFGLNYEIHDGTLFGFETGHRVGIKMQVK
ncbi:hypothetical protein [Fibrobacter sp.]|uniref:hypothetical protein n=1 Tax=Fibrobacter sp. TaxID=35828 RepID=UPI00386C717C